MVIYKERNIGSNTWVFSFIGQLPSAPTSSPKSLDFLLTWDSWGECWKLERNGHEAGRGAAIILVTSAPRLQDPSKRLFSLWIGSDSEIQQHESRQSTRKWVYTQAVRGHSLDPRVVSHQDWIKTTLIPDYEWRHAPTVTSLMLAPILRIYSCGALRSCPKKRKLISDNFSLPQPRPLKEWGGC